MYIKPNKPKFIASLNNTTSISFLRTYSALIIISVILGTCPLGLLSQSDRYLHFDGVDDFAELPNASQYFVGASGMSMTGWFCSQGLGYGHGYFGFRGPGNGQGQMYVIELNLGTLECRYISTTGFNEYVSPAGTVQAGVWQHVAWTYDGTSTRLYINGEFVGSTPSSGTFTSTTRSFGIGKSIEIPFNFVFGGRIDEVSVWSKGLSQTEIQDIMANELTGTEAELQLYYKMNQGIPGGDNTGISQLISEVGGGTRDANLTNFTLNGALSNFNIGAEDPGFTVNDHCAGAFNEATITGTPGGTFSFSTTVSDGASIDPITGSISGGIPGTTYSVQYTTNGTCPIFEIHDVYIFEEDDPSFVFEDFCSGSMNSASDIVTPGGSFSFNPNPLDGATIDPTSGSITNSIPGTVYSVQYLTTGNCPNSLTIDVTALGSPTISNLNEECSADETTYVVTFDIGEGDLTTYDISGAGILVGDQFTSDPIPSGTSYDFIISDANDCGSDQVSGQLFCTCLADAIFSGDMSICEGTIGEIEIEFFGNGPWTLEYEINGIVQPDIISGSNEYTLTVTEAGTFQFTSVTDVNCLSDISDSEPVVVTVIPAPSAVIAGNEMICAGESSSFEILLEGSGPWNLTYAINGADETSLIIDDSPYTVTVDQPGDYTISALNDSQCNGNGEGQAELIVNPLPTASIGGDIIFCSGEQATVGISLSGNPIYLLSYNLDGVPQTTLEIDQSGNFEFLTALPGLYELTGLSDQFCTGSVEGTLTVTEQTLPTATLESGFFTICDEDSQTLEIDVTGQSTWSIVYSIDGIVQAPIVGASSPLILDGQLEGTYMIESVSDALCTNSSTQEQATIEFYPPISIEYSEDVEICLGDTANLWVEASGGLGDMYSYNWSESDLIDFADNEASYSPELSGNILVTINEECNYNQSFSIPITVNQLPPISIGGMLKNCGAGEVLLTNNTPSNYVGTDCLWTIADTTIASCGNIILDLELGFYDVGLSVISPQGCFNEAFFSELVEVSPQSIASFQFSPEEPTTTESQVWFTNESVEADSYSWSFGNGMSSQEEDPIFDFGPVQGVYNVCLVVDNSFGCSDSLCKYVRVSTELLIMVPNSFTPDNDGVNDFFIPVVSGVDDEDYLFRIFDRNGNTVFESTTTEVGWNGSYADESNYYVADGLFTWQILAKAIGSAEKEEFIGTVLVLR